MSRALLEHAFASRAHHFSPFLVLGDPTPELSVELAAASVDAGATMLELGLPFSDPCADGPAIQTAGERARAAGTSTGRALELLAEIRTRCATTPFNLLVYGNLVHAKGYARFARDAVTAGASSLLVPDIPFEESNELVAACRAAGLAHVALVGPLTEPARITRIANDADGFVYLAAHQGITGANVETSRAHIVRRARDATDRRVCLGFGMREPGELSEAFAAGADIAIVGSALVRVIADTPRDSLLPTFTAACRRLAAAAQED